MRGPGTKETDYEKERETRGPETKEMDHEAKRELAGRAQVAGIELIRGNLVNVDGGLHARNENVVFN